MKKLLTILGAIALVGAIALINSQSPVQADNGQKEEKKKEEKKEIVYTVDLYSVNGKQIDTHITSSATLRADSQVEVFSKVAGQVISLKVEEGKQVKQGDVLAILDGSDTKLQLEQARVNLAKAQSEFNRIATSYKKDLVAAEEYDAKKFELDKLQADFDLAEYKYTLTKIIAPFSGVITERNVELGQTVQTSEKLFVLAALIPLEADVFLPESQVDALAVGQKVFFARDEEGKNTFEGEVIRIAPVVDNETGTVKTTLAINNVPKNVRPGSYVQLQIKTDSHDLETVVPKKAVVYDNRQQASVFKVTPAEGREGIYTVTRVEVETGVEDSRYVAIKSDEIASGDRIVLTGKEALKTGSLVKEPGLQTAGK